MAGGDGGSGRGDPPRTALRGLPAGQLRILAYASTIGPEFPFELLREALDVDEEALAEDLEGLVRKRLLDEKPGGGSFAFVEEGVRAAVYRSMTESRHRLLHRKVAEVLERQQPDPGPKEVAELGRHYFLGKVPAKSYRYNRAAATLARASDDPASAVPYLERALVDLASLEGVDARERAVVAEELGDLCYATGQFRTADRYFVSALEERGEDGSKVRARLLLARAEIARENLETDAAREGARSALAVFESDHDPLGVSQAYRLLGRIAFQEGRYREALEDSMRALDALPAGADLRSRGRLSIEIGNSFALLGDEVRPIAVEWYERAVDRLKESHDWVELARALHNLGTIVGETQPSDGLELLDRAREAADRAHDARGVGRCLLSGVELRLAVGQLEEAERDNAQAGRLLERLSDTLGLDLVARNAGKIAERRGQWDDAAAAYATAVDLARRHHLLTEEAEAEFCLANLKFKTRELEAARAAIRRAIDLGIVELSPRLGAAALALAQHLEIDRDLEGATPGAPVPTAQDRPLP